MEHRRGTLSSSLSVGLHLVILMVLALMAIRLPDGRHRVEVVSTIDTAAAGNEPDDDPSKDTILSPTLQLQPTPATSLTSVAAAISVLIPTPSPSESLPVVLTTLAPTAVQQLSTVKPNPSQMAEPQFSGGGGFGNRSLKGRAAMLQSGITTIGSETAVENGLAWLAEHQLSDGSWDFQLTCRCGDVGNGNHPSRIAATSLAIMAFYGAGYTHLDGKYRTALGKAVYYLKRKAFVSEMTGVRLHEDDGRQNMYTHGIATLALCEVHGMTQQDDPSLEGIAQGAISYIVKSQGSQTGGWRYYFGEPMGDLSSTTWQVQALKSGQLAGLTVPKPTLYQVNRFLNLMETEGGARFEYLPPAMKREGRGHFSVKTCAAMGMLMRMYLGAKAGNENLDRGAAQLDRWGGFENGWPCSVYYNYYLAMTLHHYGGEKWLRYFPTIREHLVSHQSQRGHETGSWYFPDEYYGDRGGRLLNTVLAILILEVPYRHLPLYQAAQPQ